ncbi:MAG: hypothetical protein ACRC0X_08410 [Brevinema sp.]
MKKLLILFILLSACSTTNMEQRISAYSFSTEWHGYYTKVSGHSQLQDEFKISKNYIIFKNSSSVEEKFLTYQIKQKYFDYSNDLIFSLDSVYTEQYTPKGRYYFKNVVGGYIRVTYQTILYGILVDNVAFYRKSTTP